MLLSSLVLILAQPFQGSPIDTRAAAYARIQALCPAIATLDRKTLLAQELRLTNQSITGSRTTPGRPFLGPGWLLLGCLRARLAYVDRPVKANWGVIVPEPWANQAIDVLISGLNREPAHPIASELLAAVAIGATEAPNRPVPELYEDIAVMLLRAATSGVHTGGVLRGCTSFEMAVSDTTSARLCIKYALEGGIDSTWNLLRVAWIDLRHGDSIAAARNLNSAVTAAHTPAAHGEILSTFGQNVVVSQSDELALLGRVAPDGINLKTCSSPHSTAECAGEYVTKGVHSLGMFAGMSRLWNPSNGQPIGLVTYALDKKDLVSPDALKLQTDAASLAISGAEFMDPLPNLPNARATILFRQWDPLRGTLTSRGATAEVLGGGYQNHGYATGYLFVTSQESVRSWTIEASTQFGDLERVGADGLTPLDTGALAVSDPVLGVSRDDVSWNIGTRKIVLAPMNAIYRSDPVKLYYQVKSDIARPDVTTTMKFYHVDSRGDSPVSVLQVQFKAPVEPGLNEIQRELDISRLNPGEYRLVVEVQDAARNEMSRQSTRITVK